MGGLTESGVGIDEEPLLAWVGKYEEDDYEETFPSFTTLLPDVFRTRVPSSNTR